MNDGEIIYHTGKQGPEKGEKINLTATVKSHITNKKGQNVTVVIRPRFKAIESMKVEEIERINESPEIEGGLYSSVVNRDVHHYAIMRLNRSEWILQRVAKTNPFL